VCVVTVLVFTDDDDAAAKAASRPNRRGCDTPGCHDKDNEDM